MEANKLNVNSRAGAALAQGFFGFTGLGRIYLSSPYIGILQFVLFLTTLIFFSQPEMTPEVFVTSIALTLVLTLIWILDTIVLCWSLLRIDPDTVWNREYIWYDNETDRVLGQYISGMILVAIPVFIGLWLFRPL
ncbi:MAG: hypothetical protein K0U52_08395 [Gammaproteobacteria bacterium]|nr:hypothetical protein [Gammaproteobacteria bacterium]